MRSVVFRADASTTIGFGHVMRCLTLATALRERDTTVSFVCRAHDGHLCDLIEKQGFAVNRLALSPTAASFDDTSTYAEWLGASWQDDAEQTRGFIEASGVNPDWLVIDHYGIDGRWESALRTSIGRGRIMVIDDLADRIHDCDMLLDQNLVAEMHTRYAEKVPAACCMLLGSEYALLQPIYAELHDRVLPRNDKVERIFVFFGGADNHNLTGRTLNVLLRINRLDIKVDVVITSDNPHAVAIHQLVAGHDNIQVHSGLPTLAPLMAKADLAIGGGGITSWERLCLGLPSLVITLAENQRGVAAELSHRNLIRWLGNYDTVDESTISQALSELVQGQGNTEWSQRCLEVVDGKGLTRVCAALTVMATTSLRGRVVRPEDEALILDWANDPATRRNAFHQEQISVATHHIWFGDRLQNVKGCRFYIVETHDGIPVGQVRFERVERAWEIHYLVAPIFRGRGLGCPLLRAALLEFGANMCGTEVFGRVKNDNHASRRIFESLGFHTEPRSGHEGPVVYRQTI